ncbi:MAG: helix-turn-helix transcriptional regulator [Clostridia bacterium]|nr:helix-turn-helix transcriptional regulator [Clostridia bacterium]
MQGLSQEQLAEKANISRSTLSIIEAPNMIQAFSLDTLYKIADALNVNPGDLLNASLPQSKSKPD